MSSQSMAEEGTEVSIFGGYRAGGELENTDTGNNASFGETNSYGVIIGTDYGARHVMEFLYSYQKTDLTDTGSIPNSKLLNLDIEYFQLGGSQIWDGEKTDKFFGGTLGAIHLSPNNSALSSKTRLSMSFGGGMVYKFTENIGLRLELRAYLSSLGDSSAFCGPNNQCVVVGDGFMTQVDANAGVRFRF